MFQYLIVLVCLAGPALAQIDCTGKADGHYGIGCVEYTNCVNDVGTTVSCGSGEVYDATAGGCAAINTVSNPCATSLSCPNNDYKLYVHPGSCNYFFMCLDGGVVGTFPCSNPNNLISYLVFDEDNQVCNFSWNVYVPCGILTTPAPGPE